MGSDDGGDQESEEAVSKQTHFKSTNNKSLTSKNSESITTSKSSNKTNSSSDSNHKVSEQTNAPPNASTSDETLSDPLGINHPKQPSPSSENQLTENPSPYLCPYCQEMYRSLESITTHLRVKHQSKPNFVCQNCCRVFVKHTQFNQHTKSCTNEDN